MQLDEDVITTWREINIVLSGFVKEMRKRKGKELSEELSGGGSERGDGGASKEKGNYGMIYTKVGILVGEVTDC
jgi:hypothetical protein